MFPIQQLTECPRTGHLDRRAEQRLEALHVVNSRNASGVWMRRREIESNLQDGQDALTEPLLDASLNALFDALLDALLYTLLGKISGKG